MLITRDDVMVFRFTVNEYIGGYKCVPTRANNRESRCDAQGITWRGRRRLLDAVIPAIVYDWMVKAYKTATMQ